MGLIPHRGGHEMILFHDVFCKLYPKDYVLCEDCKLLIEASPHRLWEGLARTVMPPYSGATHRPKPALGLSRMVNCSK